MYTYIYIYLFICIYYITCSSFTEPLQALTKLTQIMSVGCPPLPGVLPQKPRLRRPKQRLSRSLRNDQQREKNMPKVTPLGNTSFFGTAQRHHVQAVSICFQKKHGNTIGFYGILLKSLPKRLLNHSSSKCTFGKETHLSRKYFGVKCHVLENYAYTILADSTSSV